MTDEVFHLRPWTPRLNETAKRLIDEIHAIVPNLEILFMGAAALGLPGKNDIDLDVLCERRDLATYIQKLQPLLGTSKETNDHLAAWEFVYQGFDIDIILSDPLLSHVPRQREIFEKLRASPALLDEYRRLKEACDGLPHAEYAKQKAYFFAKIST